MKYRAMLWYVWYASYHSQILASDWSKMNNSGIIRSCTDLYVRLLLPYLIWLSNYNAFQWSPYVISIIMSLCYSLWLVIKIKVFWLLISDFCVQGLLDWSEKKYLFHNTLYRIKERRNTCQEWHLLHHLIIPRIQETTLTRYRNLSANGSLLYNILHSVPTN